VTGRCDIIDPVGETSDNAARGGSDRGSACILSRNAYGSGLVRQAQALQEDGFRVHVVCPREAEEAGHESVGGVELHRLGKAYRRSSSRGHIARYFWDYGVFFTLASMKLLSLDVEHRFRVVQVDSPPDCLVFASLFPKLAGAGVVLNVREPMPELFASRFDGWYRRPIEVAIRLTEKLSIGFADRVLTATREMRDNFGRRGADVNKITVIVDVAEEQVFRPDRYDHLSEKIARQRKEERRAGRFRVVYHGAIEERDGVDLIVRAAALLKRDMPGIEFVTIGGGAYARDAQALAGELKVGDRVTFRGDLPLEDSIEAILAADVAVVPTKGSPYSMLVHNRSLYEYVALQKPVVASRLASVAGYFPDDSVVFFDPGSDEDLADKLKFVFAHPEEMAARTERCCHIYETYRWDREKRKYLGVYHSLISP
jgi:glycosyltransferase involved in cell wall biosynthesis